METGPDGKMSATIASFLLDMEVLGLHVAMVILDESKQSTERAVLGYGGNVGMQVGERLFRVFLEMRERGASEALLHVKQQTKEVQ